MDVTPLIPKGTKILRSYDQEGFNISGEKFKGSLFLTAHEAKQIEMPEISEIDFSFFDFFNLKNYDFILIGTGNNYRQLSLQTKSSLLSSYSFKIELMATPAACRTYNVLLAEGRKIAAFFKLD